MDSTTELLAIGKQCSHTTCQLVDFLPYTCQHCKESFCQEHFLVDAHSCPKYDASQHNRVAPDCPFCNVPVAVKPGQDPNVRLEEHFEKECTVLGKKASKSPVCANGKCNKVLFAPIACSNCRKQFCPAHRFPDKHSCSQSAPKVRQAPTSTSQTRLLNLNAKATIDALKKGIPTPNIPTTVTTTTPNNPLSKANSVSRLNSFVPPPLFASA